MMSASTKAYEMPSRRPSIASTVQPERTSSHASISTRPVGAPPADAAEGAPAVEVVAPPVRLWERDWGAPLTALCALEVRIAFGFDFIFLMPGKV